ncbi:FkbM family methyltransferase [Plantactinospora sp. S1510]|uniref:FkbM family methyltransferase n=1 Tax=Plantactinospora alkalitolerans TaxID=2789879 RepID=A0ABS0H181_9ACTN|nr:FkbM family methyltransferase [Plantactinospora alkalitolerans]MBF9132221.1 FkbM family methyltransferase [Plantactinospora alkalitolerans]
MTDQAVTTGQPAIDHDELSEVVARLRDPRCPATGTLTFGGFTIEYVSPQACASTIELLFDQRIYDVGPLRGPERIIDGGGWIGLSTLRFRSLYPDAHITVFEPDPELFAILCRNIERNGLTNVQPVQAALAGRAEQRAFMASGSDNGSLVAAPWSSTSIQVPTIPVSGYVDPSVSLLKLNIEGAEADVIAELGSRLASVDQVLIEYHGFAELPQSLHEILARLDQNGHTYIVSHFNATNRSCVPPLRLDRNYRYFLLIYSRRLSD